MIRERAGVRVREARHDDYDEIAAFTKDTWPDREGGDYISRVYHDWIERDDRPKRTVVTEVDGEVAGLAQSVLLSEWEAWNQGLRVHPDHRARGISTAVTEDLFEWARERGATTVRVMVFSWNVAGLGQSRSCGYAPTTEFRWAYPEPDPDAAARNPSSGAIRSADAVASADREITANPDAAWRYWTDSAARDHLRGLALDDEESWALSQLTREHLRSAAAADGLFVAQGDGTEGFAHRVREFERESDSDDATTERWAEYGVGAWDDVDSASALFAAIARDAADRGADRTRVLIPETAAAVSDAAFCRVSISDEPDFVLSADLTA